ncbi:unnamed protein product [Somion occarium]|uniref:Uncharacterized protein n=1 Tax=Somion occarium TaxID=3059160 RepID=A0ABP1CNF5_9APHY
MTIHALIKADFFPLLFAPLWAGVLVLPCLFGGVSGEVVAALKQGFFFDWTPDGLRVPIPTTAQCETISIKWERGFATGPSSISPYFLQVYASTSTVPLVVPAGGDTILEFDWLVPFGPGTQYLICMYDINGVTGGCQAIYTVYPSRNVTLDSDDPPTCHDVPMPQTSLGVVAAVSNGPLSQYGWVDQCTDLSVTPLNGTPPYIFTVAPALHPPFNVSLPNYDTFNWTVSLSYGMPFFISMVDSAGLAWSYGPLHSGGNGPTDCLSVIGSSSPKKSVTSLTAIGTGIGGLVSGVVIGLLAPFCFSWYRGRQRKRPIAVQRLSSSSPLIPMLSRGDYTDLPTAPARSSSRNQIFRESNYQIEPFRMSPDHEFGARRVATDGAVGTTGSWGSSSSRPTTGQSSFHPRSQSEPMPSQSPVPSTSSPVPIVPPPQSVASPGDMSYPPSSPVGGRPPSHVYVVHHDGGRAPVTVYAEDGTEIVELPPRYPEVRRPTGTRAPLQERRFTGPLPNKTLRTTN